jgi:ABC-2 type transport system ATP-binding protein
MAAMTEKTETEPALAITTTDLRKAYGRTTVLDGINLRVPAGTVFALLGPNGAGKTTTVRILSTLIEADGGRASVAGHDLAEPEAVRRVIGVTGQFSAVDNLLTARENLILMADLYRLGRRPGRHRAAALLERFGLSDAADQPISTYSGGMRRRLDLAMTLVGEPRVIFLDEPTAGLDPRSRRELWTIVRELVADGVTIFLTTQYLEEADQLAGLIGVLDGGRIVAEGTAAELKRLVPGGHITLHFADPAELTAASTALASTARASTARASTTLDEDALTAQVPSDGSIGSLRSVLDRLDAAGITVTDLSVHTPDLDDVFLALTGDRR